MLPEYLRKQAAVRLVNNIKRYKYHITTGFLGTPYICEVLTRYGYSDVAYRLLLQEGCPGWLYQVKMGATTIWERWDSIRKDGTIPDNGMNSLNHYSYGSIGDWLYRSAVGIQEAAPGYKRIVVKPHTGGNFENMEASTITPYGRVSAAWKASENLLKELAVEIPFNTNAEIYVTASNIDAVSVDDTSLKASGVEGGYVKFSVGSGKYRFSVK
jgi:alpha-L-rhamnosidase